MTQSVIKTAALYWSVRHPIALNWAFKKADGMFWFGAAGVMSRAATYLALRGDGLLVARFLGAEAMGFYRRARDLVQAAINPFSGVLQTVLFPAFAEIQGDSERLCRAYAGSVSLAAITCFPGLTFVAVAAPELVRAVLGEAWEPAVPALRVLCFAGVLRSIHMLGTTLLRAKGVTRSRVAVETLHACGVGLAALLCFGWGIQGVAYGVAAVSLIPYFVTAFLVRGLVGLTWREFLAAQRTGTALALLVGAVAYLTSAWLRGAGLPDLAVLLLATAACGSSVLLVVIIVPRRLVGDATCWAMDRAARILRRRKIVPAGILKRWG